MNVFIDANIFLSFYHFTSDDLKELEKLIHLIEQQEVTLYLPQQVSDEVNRNRANKINDGMKNFEKFNYKLHFPSYCKDYDIFQKITKKIHDLEILHKELTDKIHSDIKTRELKADKLISSLFRLSKKN